MYITKITLNNVKCFKEEFIELGQPGTSLLIAGNNGAGKSAVLRSIAMGLCDRDSAASLLRELSGNFVKMTDNKEEVNEATITIELHDDSAKKGKEKFIIETKITEYPEILGETITQKIKSPNWENDIEVPQSFRDLMSHFKSSLTGRVDQKKVGKYIPWVNTFVAGYGPGLRTIATARFTEYFAPDALYSIFNYSSPLQDPETAWRRLEDSARRAAAKGRSWADRAENAAKETSNKISRLIHGVLGLDQNEEVVLEPNGLFIKTDDGKGAQLVELDARGDGHKAIAKVILDILIWYLLFKNYDEDHQGDQRNWEPLEIKEHEGNIVIDEVRGIVILDEIEQHLHPRLQRKIVKNLIDVLPNVQFVISTHSPLCLSGTCDAISKNGDEKFKIYSVYKEPIAEEDARKIKEKVLPFGKRADQILVDYFELKTTLNTSFAEKIDEYRSLIKKDISTEGLEREEKKALLLLEKEIAKISPLVAEREDDRRIEMEILESIKGIDWSDRTRLRVDTSSVLPKLTHKKKQDKDD